MRPHPDVVAKRLDDIVLLVHVCSGRIFELNETGARVWELLNEELGAEGIASRLQDEFDVERSEATSRVERLLSELRAKGLVVDAC